ncbi:MAG: winged helix-turn-helix transcriptional regulator [Pseudorhodobacter sp.]|nr:winged helix-turn-helix transcriptional regulator [Pseudorhodobacter sp.]
MLDPLSQTLAALADPTRRAILLRLSQGDATVGELAAPFALSQPAISKHIKVLQAAGLISQGRVAQTRPCRLERAKLQDLDQFMDHLRAITEGQLDQFETYLTEIQSKQGPPK